MNKIFQRNHDPIWHAQLALLTIVALQLMTNSALLPFNKILIITLELLLITILTFVTPANYGRISKARRALGIILIGFITLVNIVSLVLLLNALFFNDAYVNGHDLLINGFVIYSTKIFFSLKCFILYFLKINGYLAL